MSRQLAAFLHPEREGGRGSICNPLSFAHREHGGPAARGTVTGKRGERRRITAHMLQVDYFDDVEKASFPMRKGRKGGRKKYRSITIFCFSYV